MGLRIPPTPPPIPRVPGEVASIVPGGGVLEEAPGALGALSRRERALRGIG